MERTFRTNIFAVFYLVKAATPHLKAGSTIIKAEKVESLGADSPMGRAGQPAELAPAYVFLACEDSSYMSGQVLHINGGEVVNG